MHRWLLLTATLATGALMMASGTGEVPGESENPERDVREAADRADRPAVKLIVLLNKREGMSREEFERYYLDEHIPTYAVKIPGVRGYVVNLVEPGEEPPLYDGVAEFWFDDMETFEAALEAPETDSTLADAEKFVAPPGPQMMVVREHVIVELPR